MLLLELLQDIIQYRSTTQKSLRSYITTKTEDKHHITKGYLQEGILILAASFNGIPDLSTEDTVMLIGNYGNIHSELKEPVSVYEYIKSTAINKGSSSGKADLVIYNKKLNKIYPFTSKCYTKEKYVSDYDIQDIGLIETYSKKYSSLQVCVMVNNRQDFINNLKNAKSSNSIIKALLNEKFVYDLDDFEDLFDKLCMYYSTMLSLNSSFNDITHRLLFTKKDILQLRFHQRMFVYKTMNIFSRSKIGTQVLWGWKPRSGKTYGVGGLIREFTKSFSCNVEHNVVDSIEHNIESKSEHKGDYKHEHNLESKSEHKHTHNPLTYLIITPAPTETNSQIIDDMLYKFVDFDDYNIIHITSEFKQFDTVDRTKHTVLVVSKQFLDRHLIQNSTSKSIEDVYKTFLQSFTYSIIFFDENHFGGTTINAYTSLSQLTSKQTHVVYLTATFTKTLTKYSIPENNIMLWGIEDEILCKQRNFKQIRQIHGTEYVNDALITYPGLDIKDTLEANLQYYDITPTIRVLPFIFTEECMKNITKNEDTVYGFDMDGLFELYPDTLNFKNNHNVIDMLNQISGGDKEKYYPNGDLSVYKRITDYSRESKNRVDMYGGSFSTQLWFLPVMIGQTIDNTSKALKQIMEKLPVYIKYHIIVINSTSNIQDVKAYIEQQEKEAKKLHRYGMIILVGNMLSLGITIKSCDVVFMFSGDGTSDAYIQKIFRAGTEAYDKTEYYIVDFNMKRVVNLLSSIQTSKYKQPNKDKFKYLFDNNIISVENQQVIEKMFEGKSCVDLIYDFWVNYSKREYIKKSFTKIMMNIDKISTQHIKFLNRYFDTVKLSKASKSEYLQLTEQKDIKDARVLNSKEKCDSDEHDNVKKCDSDEHDNVKKCDSDDIKSIRSNKSETKSNRKSDDTMSAEEYTKIIQMCSIFVCIITLSGKEDEDDFLEMIKYIKSDKKLLHDFNVMVYSELCKKKTKLYTTKDLQNWCDKNFIDVFTEIIQNCSGEDHLIFDIYKRCKIDLRNAMRNKKELLNVIEELMIPTEDDKKKYGEVFTPYWMCEEMVNALDDGKIYRNPSSKFLDPAAGSGNFMIAVYYKLMDGLSHCIPDEKERSEHILTKMLYMSELNYKNVLLARIIFGDREEKYNIIKANSLEQDIFKTIKFDVIIGNPPYNTEFNEAGASPLYNKFIEKYIPRCRMLSFIIPSRWFAGGKGLDKFRSMMLSRQDIVYIKHYKTSIEVFGSHVDIKGGINYFLIDNSYNGLCNFNNTMLDLSRYDILVEEKYYNLIDKLSKYKNITEMYNGSSYFNVNTNDKRLIKATTNTDKYVKCYVSKQKGFINYIDKKHIQADYNFYKVITTEANGSEGGTFGNTFIGTPDEITSQSYFTFKCSNQEEAKSLLSYIYCKLPNFMLSIRKISQHISSKTLKWVPLPPLDRIWTDKDVYEYFKLTEQEINMIEKEDIRYKNYKEVEERTGMEVKDSVVEDDEKKSDNKDTVDNKHVKEDVIKYTVVKLKEIAKEKKIKGYSKMKKEELMKVLGL